MLPDEVLKRLAQKYKDEEFAKHCKAMDSIDERIRKLNMDYSEAKHFKDLYRGYAKGTGEPVPFGAPPHKCWEAVRSYDEEAKRIYSEIVKAEESRDKMHTAWLAAPAKTPAQWVKEHYQQLFRRAKNARTEEDWRKLAEEFRAMIPYEDNTAELAKECDRRYRILKESREEQERVARIEQTKKQERQRIAEEAAQRQRKIARNTVIITGILLGSMVGGGISALVLAEPAGATSLAMLIGALTMIAGLLYGLSDDSPDLGQRIVYGCAYVPLGGGIGCAMGAIIVLVLAFLLSLFPPAISIVIGTVVGGLIGGFIGKEVGEKYNK